MIALASTARRVRGYPSLMARSRKELDRLAGELAALSAEERAQVLALAARREELREPPANFEPPLLKGGFWVGGDLRREQLYGDDGR